MHEAYARGFKLFELKRYELALREFQVELNEAPRSAKALGMASLCEMNLGRHMAARQSAERAIECEPSSGAGYYALAWAFYMDVRFSTRKKGDIPAIIFTDRLERYRLKLAEKAIREALRLSPRDVHYLFTQSVIAFDDMRPRDALKAAETGLAINPQSGSCLRMRATALRLFGCLTEASASSAEALASESESAASHANAGWTALSRADHMAARRHFSEALRLDPFFPRARKCLAIGLRGRFFFYRPLLWIRYAGGAKIRRYLGRHAAISFLLVVPIGAIILLGPYDSEASERIVSAVLVGGLILLFLAWLSYVLANYCLEFDAWGARIISGESRWLTHLVLIFILFLAMLAAYLCFGVRDIESPSSVVTIFLAIGSVLLVSVPPPLARHLSRRRSQAWQRTFGSESNGIGI